MGRKMPYIPLFTGDWMKDPQLSMCSPLTRGIWIDLLCAIHELDNGGIITGTVQQFTRICRCTEQEFNFALQELNVTKTGHVTQCHSQISIMSRRLARESRERVMARERKRKERLKNGEIDDVTPVSRSCTSTISVSSSVSVSSLTSKELNNVGDESPDESVEKVKATPKKQNSKDVQIVLDYLNQVTGIKYRNPQGIPARLKEGYTVDECKSVIDKKNRDPYFIDNPKYMRPLTLFSITNFDGYLNEPSNGNGDGKKGYGPGLTDNGNNNGFKLDITKQGTLESMMERDGIKK